MANGRGKGRKGDTSRDAGGFIALPWSVTDCPAYARLSMHARALLLEVARQYVRDNNGKLLLSRDYMGKRGWKSNDMLTKAKRELLEAGFLHQTVMGHRPNKASWYAITWYALDRHPGYDAGAVETFKRGAYRENLPIKNASLRPSHGTERPAIAPPHGTGMASTVPPHGAMKAPFGDSSVPPHGHHLDMPSAAVRKVGGRTAASMDTMNASWVKTRMEPIENQQVTHGGPTETLNELWFLVGRHSRWKSSPRDRPARVNRALLI